MEWILIAAWAIFMARVIYDFGQTVTAGARRLRAWRMVGRHSAAMAQEAEDYANQGTGP
jgi:hypothetical protein